ncbi:MULTISPECIES: ABC transporter ATP-binding protein [Methanoregula]|jgi:putative ABC transport system ATP-binding protein|uniref:ABC-type antimicrobial peptide transport system, ATPase component n=1 Tax=Methanoregula formicica (strain DSM 22288 / NBRC 105244 / SMSP) TaxID=593750 RepID=L0HEP7_METFS|nr:MULTISPECIES: ABC transporter ATP-binding protein [Methanoregula]AGB01579.1 ABC-type antimicrobial peptide transport system, ATPase component [Methanoregula formicica SMSP]MDD5143383.1 ABC transporter ATP-binding protein [Methanoregula sp.]
MIQISDLTKIYRMGTVEVRALDGVTLDIAKGEFVGIMGASGSGKTTLLHMLGLLDDPTKGKINIEGTDVLALSDYEKTMFRLYKLGYVFQDYALVPDLTVMENVSLPAMLRKDRSEEQIRKDSDFVLERIGLLDRCDHLPRELSGGQQQRVSIARAIVNKPDILFADEPCANLDTENSRMVLDLFHDINEEMKQTIVMVSHEDWHKEYFHRIVRLKDGKVVSDGTNPSAH